MHIKTKSVILYNERTNKWGIIMLEKSILDYVDDVVSKIDAPISQKMQIENELIRHLMENAEYSSIDEVKSSLSSPEILATQISKKLAENNIDSYKNEYNHPIQEPNHPPKPNPIYVGEFMQELNNLNLKLLYIPLIQITSRTSRLIMPLSNEDYY